MIDASFGPAPLDNFKIARAEPSAFAGATTAARGDKDTASGAYTIFTVTGDVLVRVWGVCTTGLAGASGTLELGVTGNTAYLIAQTTATNITANKIWSDSSPSIGDTLASVLGPFIVPNGLDIIETTKTTDLSAGQIYYLCLWRALSSDGSVVGVSS